MKRILLSIYSIIYLLDLQGQAPQAFNYQAIVRNDAGELVLDQNVSLRISIHSEGDDEVYAERHSVLTSNVGTIALRIGEGTVLSGDFQSIAWEAGEYSVETAIDLSNGTDYTVIGNSQLISVPYALHANTSGDKVWVLRSEGAVFVNSANENLIDAVPDVNQRDIVIASDDDVSTGIKLQDFGTGGETYSLTATNNTSSLGGGKFILYHDSGSGSAQDKARFTLDNTGNVGIGTFEPSYTLDVDGSINTSGYFLNGSPLAFDSKWSELNGNLFYNNGYVGIGTETPTFFFDIRGNESSGSANPRQFIYLENTNNSNSSNVALAMASGTSSNQGNASFGVTALSYTLIDGIDGYAYVLNSDNGVVLRATNSNGNIKMFTGGDGDANEHMRIESDGDVGIGTDNPSTKLHLFNSSDHSLLRIESSSRQGGVQLISNEGFNPFINFGINGIPGSKGGIYYDVSEDQLALRAQEGVDDSRELVLQNNGNVGIGTKSPDSKLQIKNGDIYLEDIDTGVIMKSPNGTCWRLTVNDDGSLATSSIACPEDE